MSTLAASNLKNASSGSNNIVLNTDGTTTIAAPSNIIKSGTAVASTSGVAIDFTGIPSWAKRVTVMFNGVSTNGTSAMIVQIGAGSITTSGYLGTGSNTGDGPNTTVNLGFTTGLALLAAVNSSSVIRGILNISNIGSNAWVSSAVMGFSNATVTTNGASSVTLSGTLDRVRITTVNGTDTFDAGTINILWEG